MCIRDRTKVIPVFENMYKEFKGAKLPGPTKAVINASHGLIDNWYFFVGGAAALLFLITLGMRTDRGREVFDRVILRVPLVGNTLRKIIIARFTPVSYTHLRAHET